MAKALTVDPKSPCDPASQVTGRDVEVDLDAARTDAGAYRELNPGTPAPLYLHG